MLDGIDHVAIAVHALQEVLPLYRDLLGFDLERVEEIPDQGVKAAILSRGPHRLELLESTVPDGPVERFLKKNGPGLHHICLLVRGLEGVLERLEKAGIDLLDQRPRPGAGGRRVAFIHPRSTGGVLIELSEKGP